MSIEMRLVKTVRGAFICAEKKNIMLFYGFADELKVQKNSIYLKWKYVLTLEISLLLINLMHL